MELHIEGQHVDVPDAMRSMMVEQLEKLNAHHADIIHARVALVKSKHHLHGSDEARITLSMNRRKVLQAVKGGKTVEDAVHHAFDALHREVSDYRDRRREVDKQRLKTAKVGTRWSGTVVALARDQGYGFVDIGAEDEVHFVRHAVMGAAFDTLSPGKVVEVDIVAGPQGYKATRVVPF